MEKEKLSEEGKWFLKNLQRIQDNFAEAVGAQIVTTDKRGQLITEMSGQQRACEIIQKTEKGKKMCTDCYKTALSLVKDKEESVFMDCPAGFASLWVPIKTGEEQIVGSITGCGGRYDRGEEREELEERFNDLADELGLSDDIHPRQDFLKAAVEEVKVITEEEMRKRAERLAELVGILTEETALKEAFRVEGEKW